MSIPYSSAPRRKVRNSPPACTLARAASWRATTAASVIMFIRLPLSVGWGLASGLEINIGGAAAACRAFCGNCGGGGQKVSHSSEDAGAVALVTTGALLCGTGGAALGAG